MEQVVELYTALVPGRVGSDLTFIGFDERIEQSILLNLTKRMFCEALFVHLVADWVPN